MTEENYVQACINRDRWLRPVRQGGAPGAGARPGASGPGNSHHRHGTLDAVVLGETAIVFPPAEYEKTSAANAAGILAQAKEVAAEIGVSCETLHVKDRRPAEGIIETAKAKHCDLIVMGSHGRRGISRLVLGSQANEVVSHSTVPVLVCR